MNHIFIGYDTREPITYHVCSNSIIRTSKHSVSITPLVLSSLQYLETHTDGSNQFTYSRFLVPALMNYNGWGLYLDGDMIVKDDITKIWNFIDDSKAVFVVKHSYKSQSAFKYFNAINENYPRKNWSSVILWNCNHKKNKKLTQSFVQQSTGQFLHRFSWLDDDDIGELPIEWNWLPDEFGVNNNAKLLHFTLGTPCFEQYKNSPMASDWHNELKRTTYHETFMDNPKIY